MAPSRPGRGGVEPSAGEVLHPGDGPVGDRGVRPPSLDPCRRSLRIGALELDRRLFMAPMAGITTAPFRRSVRRWGAGLVFTEMISAYGVHYGNRRTLDYLRCVDEDHPIGFQLFGADAVVLAEAAARCVAAGADLVDINMACPVRKVMKTGAGAALLGDPRRAAAIVAAGAAAVCIHPRSAAQLYSGRADHDVTLALAAELPVPVIASGDVDGRATTLALLGGGVAAVMVARHALGRPWLFAEILTGAPPPSGDERLEELRLFADDVLRTMGSRAVGHLRQFWQRYRRHGALENDLARELMRASDEARIRELLSF
jgi:tRNA-dihydrouridine synthase B